MTESRPQDFPEFRLFKDPVAEGSFERSDDACDLCRKQSGWAYARPILGLNRSISTLCPWCIADGSAARAGCEFNSPVIEPVVPGVSQLNETDAAEVKGRTPGFTTWQDYGWQICCGRACRYIGEASAEDLAGRWKAAVPSIVSLNEGWSEEDNANLIKEIRKGTGPCAYVFECVECGRLHGHWDTD